MWCKLAGLGIVAVVWSVALALRMGMPEHGARGPGGMIAVAGVWAAVLATILHLMALVFDGKSRRKATGSSNGMLAAHKFSSLGGGLLPKVPHQVPHSTRHSSTAPLAMVSPQTAGMAAAGAVAVGGLAKKVLDTPSRAYNREQNTVGNEYDAWTEDGILEYYWGEHIHLGYYNESERDKGYKKKSFKEAKYDFVDNMASWANLLADRPWPDSSATTSPPDPSAPPGTYKILDVGCGVGGTSRRLAQLIPSAEVTGITLSPKQVARNNEISEEQGLKSRVDARVMDALAMDFPDNSFDIVWACESGEHMPDKEAYVKEMARVLKPGGTIVIATWCQRDDLEVPFTDKERKDLDFLYAEWTHPSFISIEEYARIMNRISVGSDASYGLSNVATDDWTVPTIPSWRHSNWVGVWDPWPVVRRPRVWYKTIREIVTLERMHRAFDRGLMQYGMMKATKDVNPK